MVKEFVNYKQALELSSLGFTEPCFTTYDDDGNLRNPFDFNTSEYDGRTPYMIHSKSFVKTSDINPISREKGWVAAPLKSQVFKWFRNNKLIESYVYRYLGIFDGAIEYGYDILHNVGTEETRIFKEEFTFYNDAESACIDHIIQLIKGDNNE